MEPIVEEGYFGKRISNNNQPPMKAQLPSNVKPN